jgi:predicted transcriptional regulator
MKDKTTVIHIRIDLPVWYKIKEIAEKESRTPASVFRQAIKYFLEKKAKK